MPMTPEVVTTVITVFGAAATTLGGTVGIMAWFARRIDQRFERIDTKFERIDGELAEIRKELGEVKIAIARLEGPRGLVLGTSR